MPDPLEIAKFNLDAFATVVRLRNETLKAEADYNFRMMEVIEKQVQIATAIEKLNALRQARSEFQQALNQLKAEIRKLDKAEEKITKFTKSAAMLAQGEWLSPNLVSPAWSGFRALVESLDGPILKTVQTTSATSEHRRGEHYCKNRTPTTAPSDAPGATTKTAVSLFRWAQSQSYMPRQGTPPYELLIDLLTTINEDSDQKLSDLAEELAKVKQELLEIRSANWKAMEIAEFPPKKPDAPG